MKQTLWRDSSSSLMLRVSAFASDLAQYLQDKKNMSRLQQLTTEDLLVREFQYLLQQGYRPPAGGYVSVASKEIE